MAKSILPKLWGDKDDDDVFSSLHREINRVFDDFGRLPSFGLGGERPGLLSPRTDVTESDDEIQVTAELPGVTEEDIDVALTDDLLTIKAEKKSEKEEKDKDKERHVVERSYGMFQRSLRLPYAVDAENIKAEYKNGVLKVSLPKPPETQAKARKIEVRAG